MQPKVTAAERKKWPKNTLVRLEKPFVDARGAIQPLVDLDMKSALIISSKKGTLRANHYHKTDWHFCYVLKGAIDYFERPVGSRAKPKKIRIKQGQLFFTPPLVEHAMKFPADTVFLTLSRNERSQKAYEEDLVRVELVKP
jgi:dTDP-4-dehydrorhamnose 3,5-epimerase-like enzyme